MSGTPNTDLYYDDVEIDAELTTKSHVIRYDDILAFADITLDRHPLHTDEEYCRTTQFGRPIAHGLYSLALMEGLKSKMYQHTSIASLGWNNVRFQAPLFPGDEVHTKVIFTHKRDSSRVGRGVVTERVLLVKQTGEVVTEGEHTTLLVKRPT